MDILVVEPGMEPYAKEINTEQEMRAIVGGRLQAIYPFEEMVAVVSNEESHALGLPFNRSMGAGYGGVFGPFFVCGLGEENFCSLTPQQMERYKKAFYPAEFLLGMQGYEPVTIKMKPKRKNPNKKPPNTQKRK